MEQRTRREFLEDAGKTTGGVTLGTAALTAANARRARGANERPNIAMIGCGGRGRYDTRGLMQKGANLTHLCDLHPGRLESSWDFLSKVQEKKPKFVKDMRAVFDAPEVDAVVVSTPDHWHAAATIFACQAGKDVYVEKPHCHNIWESQKMVEAARKYDRVVQVGTQNRSAPYVQDAVEYVRSGALGEVPLVQVYNMKPGGPFNLGDAGEPPDGFDWDAWLGRAPERPYHRQIFDHGWHQFWDYSGGDMANDGIHQIDLAMMLMGQGEPPRSVRSVGGRLVHKDDDSEVPDVQVINWDFGGFVMTFELTGYPRYMRKTTGTIRRTEEHPYWTQNATRIELYGSKRMMTVGRHGGGWVVQDRGGKVVKKQFGEVPDPYHYANFLEAVKTRKRPNADIGVADPSHVMIHMGNIATRVGDAALSYDAEKRAFAHEEANALLKPEYREGYEIPSEV